MPTKDESNRMENIAANGCLPCRINRKERLATVQHVVEGNRRLGHLFTYGSCPWHHQAVTEGTRTNQEMAGLLGPSFAHGRRSFEEAYGDERDVLVRLQDVVNANPYMDYHVFMSHWDRLRRVN